MKLLLSIFITILSFTLIASKYNEIEYRQRIVSKYNKSFTLVSVKFIREKGIQAKYQKGVVKFEIDPNTFSLVDKTGNEGLKTFELTTDELGLPSLKELFKNFDKIIFPEQTKFSTALYPDFPIWHIIVDGKDYESNVNTEFYDKFNELVNIKKLEEYVRNKYNN